MRAAIYRVPGRQHEDHLVRMARGLNNHGITTEYFSSVPPSAVDFCVVWSWRVGLRVREYFSGPVLVMERGYIGDRFSWTSLGWDGLNGRARFTKVQDPTRFETHFSGLLKPWKSSEGYALIAGQVIGDTALLGIDIQKWYRDTAVALWKAGWDIRFRQHPVEVERGVAQPHVPFAKGVTGSLQDALAGAGLVVTFNSNAGVDAILAGCATHAADAGSMVFDIASHDFAVMTPDRDERLHELAWMQWSIDEIETGVAWDIVKESMLP